MKCHSLGLLLLALVGCQHAIVKDNRCDEFPGPYQVTIYGGLLTDYGGHPLDDRVFPNCITAVRYADSHWPAINPDGSINFIVMVIGPRKPKEPDTYAPH